MVSEINHLLDVRRLLQRYGIVVYTGDLEADRDLMLDEVSDLYRYGLIEQTIYLQARKVLLSRKPQ